MKFLDHPTRNLFFTGKGGVGKTSVACATAVKLADAGKRVLLVSTDPASNLDEVLGVSLGNHPTAVPETPTLFAMNLDPEKSAAEYRERMVGPYRGLLPDAAVKSMEEQFSGSCTLEIAAFDEFSRLLGDPSATAEFDHVVFDTAPTGHTLRLLTLPSAWDGFMEQNTTGTSCLGPLAGLQAQQKLYQESVKALGDSAATTLVLVARAEPSALREADRTSTELAELGVTNQHLVVNGVFQAIDSSDSYAVALQQRGSTALDAIPDGLNALPQTIVPLSPNGMLGIESLRLLGTVDSVSIADAAEIGSEQVGDLPMLSELIDDLVAHGHGVILAMGKGGVGKTTVAAAVAVAIAERGYHVHLSTTDPAAHLAAAMNDERLPNLSVSRIDPEAETAKYSAEVLGKAGKGLDAQGKALLEEDLRSPCTEEIAVFRAFADAVASGTNKFVVLDTAPTGHTVLLLDSALAYHREVTRQTSEMPEAVENLLPRLRDPDFTRVLIVTLPESTPVHEAASLQRDLRRAEIEPYAWVVNQTLAPLPLTDPLMKQRQSHEQPYLREVSEAHANRVAMIPWQIEPPTGLQGLSRLTHSDLSTSASWKSHRFEIELETHALWFHEQVLAIIHRGGDGWCQPEIALQFGERQLARMDRCSIPRTRFCHHLAFETKETCVDFSVIVTAIFGAFVVFGGVMGYVKAKSKASLIAGGITGGLLLLSAFLIAKGMTAGAILGIVVSLLLIGQFGPSLKKKMKVMPNLLVVILGLVTVATLVVGFFI